jgi:YlmC/YmxH family sporulation protein
LNWWFFAVYLHMMENEASRGWAGMKITDFQSKDVINIVDGKKLGQISDLELDPKLGGIASIIVPGTSKFFGLFGVGEELVIPWRNIVKIGVDVVLVKIDISSPPSL